MTNSGDRNEFMDMPTAKGRSRDRCKLENEQQMCRRTIVRSVRLDENFPGVIWPDLASFTAETVGATNTQ
jgi:hypothetical protein